MTILKPKIFSLVFNQIQHLQSFPEMEMGIGVIKLRTLTQLNLKKLIKLY